MKTDTLYTIGYAPFTREEFIAMLQKYRVQVLVDVRSWPHSAYRPEFNKEELMRVLPERGLMYRHYGDEFGARREDPQEYTDGQVDFEKVACSSSFAKGMQNLAKGMEMGYTFALMCAEKFPETCHRTILVARAFYEKGYRVRHIQADGTLQSQEEVEEILIHQLAPDYFQGSLFDDRDKETVRRDVYRLQNKKIGFYEKDL